MNGSWAYKVGPEEANGPEWARKEKKQTHGQYVEKREWAIAGPK